jgi:enoyl-CoA hydratase/carnithine racemase
MSDIRITTVDGIRTITFDRPSRKNALTIDMYRRAAQALQEARTDPAIRVVLITGSGDAFTSGNDVKDFMDTPPQGDDSPVFQFLLEIKECEKPIVIAVNGIAVGIGVTMLLHADVVYVADTATLKLPFTTLGLCVEGGASFLLPRIAGHARAAELLLFGEAFDAQTALEVGLCARVIPAAELLAFASERARILAHERPLGSLMVTKRLMKSATADRVSQAFVDEAGEFMARLGSDEAKEAFMAFFEKRKPNFQQFG